MHLHLGNDFSADVRDIVGIFDIENTTVGKCTKKLLERAEREHRCIYATMDMPRSFIIVMENGRETVYISQLAVSTLKKRISDISIY
jgi:hypothetical protein